MSTTANKEVVRLVNIRYFNVNRSTVWELFSDVEWI